jgi:hypothetical protein
LLQDCTCFHRLEQGFKTGSTSDRSVAHSHGIQLLSKVLPESPEERMPHLALGRLRPVFDLGEQLRLHPDATVRDPLSVGCVLTQAFDFQVMVACVQCVTEGRGWLGWTLVTEHPHVPSLAGKFVGFRASFLSALRFRPDRRAVDVFSGLGVMDQGCGVILRIGKPLRIAGVDGTDAREAALSPCGGGRMLA